MNQAAHQSFTPASDLDPFSDAAMRDPFPLHEQLREAGPIVWLNKWDCWATGRHKEINEILANPTVFSSAAGVGLANFNNGKPWRPPSMLLEADAPEHTPRRAVVARVLSAPNLKKLRADFEVAAEQLMKELLDKKEVDGVTDIAERFILKVFPDAVGLGPEGRENLIPYGSMVFNSFGPDNEIRRQSMDNSSAVAAWIMENCQRENLRPGGLGSEVFDAADRGEITLAEAPILVRSFLSAGIDTTVNGIGLALSCFARFPDQWTKICAKPSLVRAAFLEVLRLESPFHIYFRTTTQDTEVSGVPIEHNQKVLVSVGAANRDPRRWTNADVLDIERQNNGHMGFGAGIHGCIGQMIARLETEVLFTALARNFSAIEIIGQPIPRLNNVLRGLNHLPLRLHAAV
jgi:cytochrome P450